MTALPISELLTPLNTALTDGQQVLLQAPPGAGKSTWLPMQLLKHPAFLGQKILMLEPRRLATRSIARYIASQLGEKVGQQVGYRVRGETCVGPETRLEIVTEGILTRMLQQDPELNDIGLVIFDEFHERSIHADTALALVLEVQDALRDDLKLLVMSATLEHEAMAELIPSAAVLHAEGRCYPVTHHYKSRDLRQPLEPQLAALVKQALTEYDGNLLVFLPGGKEIRRLASLLTQLPANTELYPLYGELDHKRQDAAIAPTPKGQRKIVLATNIAETSLTIEGISLVIDSGLVRKAEFNRNNGISRLRTQQISQASAEQRAGRAGRLQAGHCWRLWSQGEQERFARYDTPEILTSDLLSLALELARWGVQDANELHWLNPPPANNLEQARGLLRQFDAINDKGQLTPHGKTLYGFGTDPRLAQMLLMAGKWQQQGIGGIATLAAYLAALLEQRDPIKLSGASLEPRVEQLMAKNNHSHPALKNAVRQAKQYLKKLKLSPDFSCPLNYCGVLLSQAFPDRIAKRRQDSERYQLANGYGALVNREDQLQQEEFLVVADLLALDGQNGQGQIFLAAPLGIDALEELSPRLFEQRERLGWDSKSDKVVAEKQKCLGQLVLKREPLANISPDQLTAALLAGIRAKGIDTLPWQPDAVSLRQRMQFAHGLDSDQWPDCSDEALLDSLDEWLAPFMNGMKKLGDLRKLNLREALMARLPWPLPQQLDSLLPTHFEVPTGSRIRLEYGQGDTVRLSVRIQEMFGHLDSPSIANGQIKLLVELLSPAQRPLQLTQDLATFWQGSYQDVKKEMKGRYPKHYWPDDPAIAMPTRRTKKYM